MVAILSKTSSFTIIMVVKIDWVCDISALGIIRHIIYPEHSHLRADPLSPVLGAAGGDDGAGLQGH